MKKDVDAFMDAFGYKEEEKKEEKKEDEDIMKRKDRRVRRNIEKTSNKIDIQGFLEK